MTVRYHPAIGHLFVPNLNARIPNETGGYFIRTNSQGFRSDCEFVRERGERPRILMLGDSYLAGDNIGNPDRFSDLLARMLDVEVYNYGLSGSGLDQALLIHRHFAVGVEADLVIVVPSVDTIRRIQVSHRESVDRVTGRRVLVPKPYFLLEGDELRLHHEQVPRERPDAPEASQPVFRDGRRSREALASALEWYRTSPRTRRLRTLATYPQQALQSALLRRSNVQPYSEYKSRQSPGWQLLQAIMHELIERLAPLPVLIAPIPSTPFLTHRLEPIYQPLFEGFEERGRGVHVVDLTSPMTRGSWRERRALSFQYDSHFSAAGHRKAAEILAGAVEQRGLLPQRARTTGAAPAPSGAARSQPAERPLRILGISCFYHDSAAALVEDGRIVASAAEERFSRVKNDRRFPGQACNYCLEQGGIGPEDLDAVVYYDNASLTFERLLHTQASVAPAGREMWHHALPSWVRFKLHLPQLIRKSLHYDGLLLQEAHHRSHCASAFYPSPFADAAILTVDGVGEWATASIARGSGREIELLEEMRFPNSLGLLYSAFTQFTGFKVNSGEYKMMGLAPYGRPIYVDAIMNELIDLKPDGSLELNPDYFGFLKGRTMTNESFEKLFDGPALRQEGRITQREMDLAKSIQVVTEESLLRMARHAHELTGEPNLCLAGGVAFNCVANGRLLREGPFDELWIQPAAGDAGCALGAALDAYHGHFGRGRPEGFRKGLQGGSYLGPEYSRDEIEAFLETHGHAHHELDEATRASEIARLLDEGKVVGHFSGRAEFGPRALGSRSILGDPRNREMQTTLNLKIKYRESFRPFAPTILEERTGEYFELDRPSPYMQIVAYVRKERRLEFERGDGDDMLEIVRKPRSDIPAVTHVDYSARIQTIRREHHPEYYDLVKAFGERTGTPVVVNTSFNVRGEPIVCSPEDAYRCFMGTEMDVLVLGDFLLRREEQATWRGRTGHVDEREADPQAPGEREPLARGLDRIFDELAGIAEGLRARGALTRAGCEASRWIPYAPPESQPEIFRIPAELDRADPDPQAMATAITRYWSPGEAREALRPLVAKLIALGLRHPLEESLAGEVEDSVYVMF
jgi:carbamoyltransferase